ncbi:uncharacterized protein HMPREF1541_06875 [Cyphellophora europaea CBS 101466]|uniref:Glutathione S-transferase kappa n=1 Tax=Cyphellophora europaea (strain CBS 101466) TaxID=1220924 RepID=W2RR93_CYPE1|nr:uncharacterized protein HMPREF1541_06875 [Cyphellophora europaea CBS 101466]ETN38835.1 hypothetical protein HMPREF1541_06875 [Cyphellophora europaea CBS 101466]
MPGKITIYVDVVSPFAYMGYYILRHSAAFKDITVEPVPILLGGLMKATGNITPISVKNKDKWIEVERHRWARIFGIPMCGPQPPGFPVNMLKPDRALAYLHAKHPTHLPTALDAVFHQFWGLPESNVKVAQPDGEHGFLAALEKALPKEVFEGVREGWNGDVAKGRLGDNTKMAEGQGVFGLPWFACENGKGEKEGFWGVDHLGQVVRFMGLEARGGGEVLKALL